mmetsp:Transcript_13552/g.42312  ORF Transcript_13552/g.42312 Transcript_13552/m.42312 type:complete len:200 (-) Transcript_13552:144-743(-)
MHLSAACLTSRCFSASALSRTRNPASETACATCCQALGSPFQSQGSAPLPNKLASSPRTPTRWRSMAFCMSLASSAVISCSGASAAAEPRLAPFPRPRPRTGTCASPTLCRKTRSAAQRRKKMMTFATVRASRAAACCWLWSLLLAAAFFTRPTSASARLAASVRRSTMRACTPVSKRAQAWSRANTREKDSSSARSYP